MSSTPYQWNIRGSEWNRWDPHIHAPGTINNDSFNGDWLGYVKAINNAVPAIRALGITDYYSIETYRQVRARKAAGELPNVDFIFPNVEVRLDIKTAKAKGINLHLLFSPDDPKHEENIERILGQLNFEYDGTTYQCNRTSLISFGKTFNPNHTAEKAAYHEGVQQFKISFTALRDLFRREAWLRENCLIAIAGGQGDGLAGLQSDDAFKATREEMQRFAHIIFSGNPSDREYWLGKKDGFSKEVIERKYGGLKPCLHGSDAHELNKVGVPDEERYCWIKGDLAFETLRQAAIESEQRIWIGREKPLGPAYSVTLDTIRPISTPWLRNEAIPLNSGLTAIIGARGSGKTALADLIACGAGALVSPLSSSSFLLRATEHKELIGNPSVEEVWRDKNKHTVPFRPPPEDQWDAAPAAVRYLSQQFVDRLCSSSGLASELRSEIERVIFDQTDPTQRYETDNFLSLAAVHLDPIRNRRTQEIEAVSTLSQRIADEQRLAAQLPKMRKDRAELDTLLTKQRQDIVELIPKGKETRTRRLLAVETACTALETKIETHRKRIVNLDSLLAEANHLITYVEPMRLTRMKEKFPDASLTEVEWNNFKLGFVGDPITIIARAKAIVESSIKSIQAGNPQALSDKESIPFEEWSIAMLREEREKLKKEVGIDKERMGKYDLLKKTIDKNDLALKNADKAIIHAEGADSRKKDSIQSRRNHYRSIFEAFNEEEEALSALYEPLHAELKDATGSLGKLRFSVKRNVNLKEWVDRGEKLLDCRKTSPFQGNGALAAKTRNTLLSAWEVGTAEAVAEAMHSFLSEYSSGFSDAMPNSITQEMRPEWFRSIGEWLYSTDHLTIQYSLEYDGTNVENLSPGTRGIVLLLLYLAVDKNDRRPLLIDQPEENLDPKSVFDDLVPHFREARNRRQIIIVTHNANLVVNTDADQVIVATSVPSGDGGLPIITYNSGSLENSSIRTAVCDILEGGARAFLERQRRFRLQWEKILE